MPDEPHLHHARLLQLKNRLEAQGGVVRQTVDAAVEAVFDGSADQAQRVREAEEQIDREDVLIERDAVELLDAAVHDPTNTLGTYEIRLILTIVKVNNEYERIADLAVRTVSQMGSLQSLPEAPPRTFRVLANSVVGIVQTTCGAFETMDPDLARLVLTSDDATEDFREQIAKDMEQALVEGRHTVDFAFALNRVSAALARMTDHCTNVAEQIIYVATGKIVRHSDGAHWDEPTEPEV